MSGNLKVRSQQQEAFWGKQISEYEKRYKYMSLRDFCDKQKLNYNQLIYRRQQLKKINSKRFPETLSFLPVKISEEALDKKAIEIYYKDYLRVIVPIDAESKYLISLLNALENSHANAAAANQDMGGGRAGQYEEII